MYNMDKNELYNKMKNEIEKSINYYKTRIESWQNVKRLYKKDGSDFKNLSQNFANCKIGVDFLNNFTITIFFYDENNKYKSDYIDLVLEEDNKEIKKEENQSTFKKYSWSKNECFTANPTQIEKMIQNRIEKYKKWMDENIEELKNLDKLYDVFYNKLFDLLSFVENETNYKNIEKTHTLYYAMIKAIDKSH